MTGNQAAAPTMLPSRLDQLGMTLSALCLIHCLIIPVTAALTPLLARSIAMPEWVHLALLGAALPVATVALARGWRQHRQSGVAFIGISGLLLLGSGLAAHEGLLGGPGGAWLDPILTSIGACLLGSAHLFNWRLGCAPKAKR